MKPAGATRLDYMVSQRYWRLAGYSVCTGSIQQCPVWLLPVGISLLLAVPLSVYSSRLSLGRLMRRWRLFLIPEEIRSPQVIKYLQTYLEKRRENQQMDSFVQAMVDPYANAVHVGLLRGKRPKASETIERNRNLREFRSEGRAGDSQPVQ